MHSNPTTQHPGANFILKSFSASIKDSSLEGDNFFVVIDTQSIANDLGCFLDEKKIKFDCEDTQFLIDLSSIPESLVKPAKKQLAGATKLEKFMEALRSEGADPVLFSKRTLMKGQVFVNITNGSEKRVDFFDAQQAAVLVPVLTEMGFSIRKGACKDAQCYMVDLDKSLSGETSETTPVVKTVPQDSVVVKNETVEPVISFTKKHFKKWLATTKLPEISSFGMEDGKRAYYFSNTADRDLVLQKLKESFPTVTFTGTGARTVLIEDKNINKSTRKTAPTTKTQSTETLSDTMTPAEIQKALKKCKLKKKSSTYFAAGEVPGIDYDTRPYYMKTAKDREKFFEYLEKNHPNVVITKYKEICILIKSSGKTYTKKPKTVQGEKVATMKIETSTTETPLFMEELKELLMRHNILPAVEQPVGVLIPDSLGETIVLPHGALLGTGPEGITISLTEIRKLLKNK